MGAVSFSNEDSSISFPKIQLPKLPAQSNAGPKLTKDLLSGASSIKVAIPLIGNSNVTVKAGGVSAPTVGSMEVRVDLDGSSIGVRRSAKDQKTAIVATIKLGEKTSISAETVADGGSKLSSISVSQKLSDTTTATASTDPKGKITLNIASPKAQVSLAADSIKVAFTINN